MIEVDASLTAPTIHIVGSLGGHLELLESLQPALEGFRAVWITSEGARAQALRERGEAVLILPRLDRSSPSIPAMLRSASLALSERPKVILTSGAGLVVPFCAMARVMGASVIFTETMARVQRPSMSGRVASLLGARVFVQWKELKKSYPNATVCRPLLLENLNGARVLPGAGTFVTLGSHDQPFTRLTSLISDAVERDELPRPIVVQDGTRDDPPAWADVHHRYVTPTTFQELAGNAALIITHGGAGAIATALKHGRTPVVVPRLKRCSEHVDDHQVDLAQKLESLELIVRGDAGITADVVRAATARIRPQRDGFQGASLVDAVRSALLDITAHTPAP